MADIIRPLLRGPRVYLNAWTEDDLAHITRWHEDETFARLFDSRPALSRRAAAWEAWLKEMRDDPNTYSFAVRAVEDGRLLGLIEVEGIQWNHAMGWLAMALAPGEQGRGYGEEALRLLLDYAFSELNLFRVNLAVFEYNTRAIRLYERVGFVREGRQRQSLNRDGRRWDMLTYGLLRDEWQR